MRTRNAIERLAAAGRPLLADADALMDGDEQEQILERILASDRPAVRRRRPIVIALVAAVVIGGAIATVVTHGMSAPPTRAAGGHHEHRADRSHDPGGRLPLPDARRLCRFRRVRERDVRLPPGSPETPANGMRAAASADGGCVEALYLIAGSPNAPTPSPPAGEAVDVGSYQGYYDAQGDWRRDAVRRASAGRRAAGVPRALRGGPDRGSADRGRAVGTAAHRSRRSGTCSRGRRARCATGRARSRGRRR